MAQDGVEIALLVGIVQWPCSIARAQRRTDERVERRNDMEVVGEAFGPVFPRMGSRIGGDELSPPFGRALVVSLQRLSVVRALVAEFRAESLEFVAAGDQAIQK